MGVLFIAFTVVCTTLAFAALLRPTRAVHLAAVGVCGSAVLMYAATRLVAFPQLADDVGNWFEPLGVVSVVSETVVVLSGLLLAKAARS